MHYTSYIQLHHLHEEHDLIRASYLAYGVPVHVYSSEILKIAIDNDTNSTINKRCASSCLVFSDRRRHNNAGDIMFTFLDKTSACLPIVCMRKNVDKIQGVVNKRD